MRLGLTSSTFRFRFLHYRDWLFLVERRLLLVADFVQLFL